MIIKEINGIKKIYKKRRLLGTISKFCCGVDFMPKGKKCIFSILSVKLDSDDLLYCIDKIMTLEIPNKYFHYNFTKKLAESEKKIIKYQKFLNKLI